MLLESCLSVSTDPLLLVRGQWLDHVLEVVQYGRPTSCKVLLEHGLETIAFDPVVFEALLGSQPERRIYFKAFLETKSVASLDNKSAVKSNKQMGW